MRPLVLVMPRMSGYIQTFKVEDKKNELMSFRIDDKKLLEKYGAIWTKIEDLQDIIKLKASPVYDDGYIKTKIRTYDNRVYTNLCGLNVPENDVECESFTVISIYEKYNNKKHYLGIFRQLCL